jgi:hypothetical protein
VGSDEPLQTFEFDFAPLDQEMTPVSADRVQAVVRARLWG